jgi:RHS repeat-associated protein
VHYVYDEAGHLLGEYNSTGVLIQETIWLGDTPVATLRPGTPIGIFYVHTDHLNTPRRITQPSGNQLRWTWEADPFGTATPNENPASLGAFKYNLRFPGQIYDSHGGLMQNYFRDYDPAIGRYVESDPVGLSGGLNPYWYAEGNPLRSADPLGLCVDRDRCAKLRDSIDRKFDKLKNEFGKYDPEQDYLGGHVMRWGSGFTKPGGHFIEISDLQRGLANDIAQYEKLRCDEDDPGGPGFGVVGHDILDAATRPVPPPRAPLTVPMQMPSNSSTNAAAAAVALLLLMVLAAPVGM